MQGNNAKLKTSLPLLIALALAGCGGGGDSSTPNNGDAKTPTNEAPAAITLSGVAAAGAPISGTVTVHDSNSTKKTVDINADGSFSVDVSGLKAPFMLQAAGTVGDRSYTIYSAATGAGRVNVTPLTDLVVANAAGGAASTAFEDAAFSNLTDANLNAAEATLKTRLDPVLQATGSANTDLMNGVFAANHTGLDAALDLLDVKVDESTKTATITVKGDSTATISDSLTDPADSDQITVPADLQDTLTDIQAIAKSFENFNAAWATASGPSDPKLAEYFVQNGFLWLGLDLNTFLSRFYSDLSGFKNTSVVNFVKDSQGAIKEAWVTLVIEAKNGRTSRIATWMYKDAQKGWVIEGDQRIADLYIKSVSKYNPYYESGQIGAEYETGVQFDIEDLGMRGIDYAVINGPGLGSSGLMLPITDQGTMNRGYHYAVMDDAAIGTLSDGAVYKFNLYDNSNTPNDLSDDVLLNQAPYEITLPRRPFMRSELKPGMFPALTPESVAALKSYAGGAINLSWTLPSGLESRHLSIGLYKYDAYFNRTSLESSSEDLTSKALSGSMNLQVTDTPTGRSIDLGARDPYGRRLSYATFFNN